MSTLRIWLDELAWSEPSDAVVMHPAVTRVVFGGRGHSKTLAIDRGPAGNRKQRRAAMAKGRK